MLSALADNVFHFSAAKNRSEIEALTAALRDENGKPISFAEFKRRASKITGEFQGNWLKAEYDLAINASTMAARWAEHSANPNAILIYRTAGDARVRQSHKQLEGISKPINDPFWNTYYPPNGWNCRCDVEKTLNGRITPDDQLPLGAIDDVPPMFQVNLGKQGFAFPPNHPYFVICKESKRTRAPKNLDDKKGKCGEELGMSMSDARYKKRERPGKGQTLISNAAYDEKKASHPTNGKRYIKEYQDRIFAADAMAKHYDVAAHVTPDIHAKDWRHKTFFKGAPKGKSPDLKIDGEFWEVKSYEGNFSKRKVHNMLSSVKGQSDNMIMRLNEDVDIDFAVRHVRQSALKRGYPKKIVIVDKSGSVHEVL